MLKARPRQRQEHPVTADPVVGKDILELLSSAMYLDPRTVYREYIQNSADAIDVAFAEGLFSGSQLGRVDIHLNRDERSVRIRDNGCGIPAAQAERILTSFGASSKRGKSARGFRGVGRLAAFGYAQTVSFRTKAAGESVSTEVRWDCRKLKDSLLNPTYTGDLRQVVRDVVTVVVQDESDVSAHFFEVVLDRVIRIRNDVLLNPEVIGRYLSEVAPAPFDASFSFGSEILSRIGAHVPPGRFCMYLNGSDEPITRPHRKSFAVTTVKSDVVTEIEHFLIPSASGGVAAVGWIGHHAYLGAIHGEEELRGLRARVGDIQIGSGDLFLDVFPESRFNSWTIGELHIVDSLIIPNGRRDGFEQNAAYSSLLAEVVLIARRQATRCRQSSTRRNRLRGFEAREKKLQDLFAMLGQRAATRAADVRARREIGVAFNEMKRLARSSVLSETDQRRLQRRLASLEARYEGLRALAEVTDPFADATPAQRTAYSTMVDLIYDCSSSKAAARVLVDKIMSRLVAQALRARRRRRRKS
jgi:Histidine kinase-, DNA gyrase B-, and HSP90-like ATPase